MLRLLTLSAATVIRVATVIVFTIGLGAAAATAVAWSSTPPDVTWAAPLSSFSLAVAFVGVAAATMSFLLLPSVDTLNRRGATEGPRLGPAPRGLLVVLLAVTVLQLPNLGRWWRAAQALFDDVFGGPDPLGLAVIPAGMLYSLPALATLLLIVFGATSLATLFARRDLARRILTSAVVLQGAIIVLGYVTAEALQQLLAWVVRLLGGEPIPDSVATGLAMQAQLAGGMIGILVAIFAGYFVTLFFTPRADPEVDAAAAAMLAAASGAELDDMRVDPAAVAVISSVSSAFPDSNYLFKVRNAFIGHFAGRRFIAYDIDTVPPRSRERLSFAWNTGILRREPSGPDLIHVQPAERHGMFRRAYVVTDATTGALVGKLAPDGSAWELLDALGRRVAEVQPKAGRFKRTNHVGIAEGQEVCRYNWNVGLTVGSSEMEVEFLPVAASGLDRALAMALAPILEDRIRRARRK